MTALNSLTYTSTENVVATGSVEVAGTSAGIAGNVPIIKNFSLKTGIANASPGGADEELYALFTITNSGNVVIDLANFTDIAGQTGAAFFRVKSWRIWLLGLNQAAPDGTIGTACSGITVGGGTTPFEFNLSGSNTKLINNSSQDKYDDGSGAGFTVVSGTNNNVKILNNDSGNSAIVLVNFVGGSN